VKDSQPPSELRHVDFVLVGGGLASATAAETLRAEGATGSILLLCAEGVPPYHRPPLTKQTLPGSGDNAPSFIHPEGFYREQGIDLRLDARVVAIDTAQQTVTMEGGELIGYRQLLIATGATPRTLSIPGMTLAGIHTLRNKIDADAIRQDAAQAGRAVVLGGSFLGMEIAFALLALGLHVTIVELGSSLLSHLEAPDLSVHFQRYAESRGISVVLNDTAAAVHGERRVQEVETAAGRRLPCDLLVVSIGVGPASEFLAGSGIAIDLDGWVFVDSLLRTNAPNVFAAGDITVFHDPVFARLRHIEHWDNAVKQGRLAAKNMLGRRLPYDEISYFYCEFGDVGFDVLGATEEGEERIARGSLDARSCAIFYLKADVPRALFSIGRPADETRVVEGLIRFRVNLHAVRDRLSEPAFGLDRIPAQTALILQGGGALGAFECGVVKALEEERIFPDIVAGVSIGAFNGAIIASNPRCATRALEAFWDELTIVTSKLSPAWDSYVAALNVLGGGVPKFFRPRWMSSPLGVTQPPALWTSFYDTTPMRELITKYVDFSKLKSSPVRLLISAVDVETAELEIFDSFVDDLTPEHVMASGSLPPGFPWTVIDGKAYWDGGIISNSPLDLLVDRCGPDGKRVFVVDLYGGKRPLPSNMMEVLARRDEIVYSERVRSDLRYRETVEAYRGLIKEIFALLDPAEIAKVRQEPRYIQLMGDGARTTITRLVRIGQAGESASRDYDFSDHAIAANKSEGYLIAKKTIEGS